MRKSYLLSVINACYKPTTIRSDILNCTYLRGLPLVEDVWYYHGFTTRERKAIVTTGATAIGALLIGLQVKP